VPRRLPTRALALGLALALAGCSTLRPRDPGRDGLFARLGKWEHAGERTDGRASTSTEQSVPTSQDLSAALEKLRLRWPLSQIRVTSGFGQRGHEFHEGVDLKAGVGTPVYAAESGTVIYAGRKIHGYGKMVVIRHHADVATVYAHNSKLLVRHGQRIGRGQKIALSGRTGKVSGPHLHFEVRSGVVAVDPVPILPSSRLARGDGPDPLSGISPPPRKGRRLSRR
jgi:murein DD-endopeptidase MepM/ murein hydrolase activator NlpD